jgi:hypothetical protein
MKRYLLIAAAAAALAVPDAFADNGTPSATSLAAQNCKTQLQQLGAATFRAAHGGGANAYGKCVSLATRTANGSLQSASAQCKAAQSADAATFKSTYGGGANAYGKCVSAKAKAATQQATAAVVSAAKQCKTLAADKTTFASTYGTGRNAFGRCVSQKSSGKTG